MIDPAAPYAEPGSTALKYRARRYLPIKNKKVVKAAPTCTDFQVILAEGKYLNMVANKA